MTEAKPNKQEKLGTVVASLVILMACAAAYSNTFGVPFLFDDLQRIRDEVSIRTVWPPTVAMHNSNRPFAHYTFALNYMAHGYELWGYHAVNLCVHCLAALCLFGLTNQTSTTTKAKCGYLSLFLGGLPRSSWSSPRSRRPNFLAVRKPGHLCPHFPTRCG